MKLVHLLPVGKVDDRLLQSLRKEIPLRFKSSQLDVSCEILSVGLDPRPAYHSEREQYHSSEILRRMQTRLTPQTWRLLGVADVDLYIPILKYIFGEAQMDGPCALISANRLSEEFYGLQRDDDLLSQRLLKEAVHELGHTMNLRHCPNYDCVMASAHAVEWVDLRGSIFCDTCRGLVSSITDHASTADVEFRFRVTNEK